MSFVKIYAFQKAGHRGATKMYSMWKIMLFFTLNRINIALYQIHQILFFLAMSYDPFKSLWIWKCILSRARPLAVNHYIKAGLGNRTHDRSIFTINQTLFTCLNSSHRLHSDCKHKQTYSAILHLYCITLLFLIRKIAHVLWHLNRDVQRVPQRQGLKCKKKGAMWNIYIYIYIHSGYGKYSDPLKFFTLCYIAAIC